MALYRNNGKLFTGRRSIIDAIFKAVGKGDHGSWVVHRGRRFGRVTIQRLSQWFLLLVASFSIYMSVFGPQMFFQGAITPKMETENSILLSPQEDFSGSDVGRPPKSKHRKQHFPCEVGFLESVDDLVEPKNYMNFTQFSLSYIDQEEKANLLSKPQFGGYQSLEEREISFYARNQTLHCGFAKGPAGSSSTGFDLNDRDKAYMNNCKIVVSSCIFGSFDFLRRPKSRLVSLEFLLKLFL